MFHILESAYYDNLRTDEPWTDAEGHEGIPQFKWMKRGDQFDLLISNYREKNQVLPISNFAHHNYLDINIEMAQVFWIGKKSITWQMGGVDHLKPIG
ncbi:hypothetical protein OS493_007797 [Desmophyllum pertusum]|uniref:Uncharacterized protein n=1 Tax=Desmophyllum pertusum TaxID=174260 RepID=A0A9W9YS07_9CNID|nr:hypothetical protein OS493_007797 [Desmophyllum pertusum]